MNFADVACAENPAGKDRGGGHPDLELEKSLSDSGLYAKDPKRFADLSARLVKICAEKRGR